MMAENPWERCLAPLFQMTQKWLQACADEPQAFWGAAGDWWQGQMQLWNQSMESLGQGDFQAGFGQYLGQSHQLLQQYWLRGIEALEGLDETEKRQFAFWVRQYLQLWDPQHQAWANPKVMERTLKEDGQNLLRGFEKLCSDLRDSPLGLNVPLGDLGAFELGRDLASTQGQVVRETPLFQLIQYAPSTEQVRQTPILMVPPCINKYYVLDLRPENSFIRHLVDAGFTVYLMSWVNPDSALRDKGMEDYVLSVVEASGWVRDLAGSKQLHGVGYCVGGTLLAMAAAWQAARGTKRLASLSLMTTLLDFSDPGEPGMLLSPALIDGLLEVVDSHGLMDGRMMALGFSLLREKELYWPAYVQQYLLGEKPPAFDLLAWNSDATHLPARFYRDYLGGTYRDNLLAEPGAWRLGGQRLDLSRIKVPAYVLATEKDHIVPWHGAMDSARLLGSSSVRRVLSSSGHVAGVINPPARQKYGYRILDENLAATDKQDGSWWPDWYQWLAALDSKLVPARPLPPGIEPAPGRYVRKRP
ncbi:alpha/beta fold hydrolase [Gallaecimonas sp. GXIMD4217]|uniref:PHA/PHB synthase family protein n=1 Tax=Gallaecimonas sp. GXIMD4217 TaxID=3131927 RepID=UPI00311B396F